MSAWTDDQIDRYAQKWGDDPTNLMVLDAADLEGDEAVLDIGCGTGYALKCAAERGHTGRLVGIDPYKRMIGHAKARAPGQIEFLVAPSEVLPFADDSFDTILAINSVHHWADRTRGLAEMSRALKPGGTFAYGGEVFFGDMIPDGQDYTGELTALGFACRPLKFLNDNNAFTAIARKELG